MSLGPVACGLAAKPGLQGVLRPQARAVMAIWLPPPGQLKKERPSWQGGLELADFPAAHGRLNSGFKARPPMGPLSFGFTAICHHDHQRYIYVSQLLGDVRMLHMVVRLIKMRHE